MGIGLSVNPPRVCTWLSAAFGSPQRADPLWMDPMVNWRATAAQWNRSGTIATCKPSGQLGDCLVSSKKSAVRCRLKSWFLPCQPPAVTGISTPAQAAKVSQQAVKYQDTSKGEQRCETCVQFEAPSTCKTVDGTVAAQGWCLVYARKPA
jgi:hypothetical protein